MKTISMTVAAIKSELKRRHLPTDGTKKVLAARLDDAVSKEEEEKEKDGGPTAAKAGKRKTKATAKNEEKGGTKRKGRTMDFDEKDDDDVLGDDSTLNKRQKTTTTTTTTTTTKSAIDDVSKKEPTPPSAPPPRRGRSRSKSAEPEETSTEEERKKKDEKRNGGGKAAAAMKEKMQKAKELMKKQKALAEKMKKKKTERGDKGDGEAPPPMTTTTTRTTRTMQPPISAQQAIEKARETAARLAALQHQHKKNKQSNQSITESKFEKTGPAPVLRVNEKGQEVDENGKVIVRAKDYTATTKVNEKQKMRQAFLQAEREVAMEEMRRRGDLAGGKKEEHTKEDMIDPDISVKQKHNRKKSSLQFVAKGTYEKQADFTRLVNRFGEVDAKKIRAREEREKKRAAHTEALEAAVAGEVKIDIGEAIVRERPEDDVEWWDKPFLKDGKTYADVPLDDKVLEDDKIGTLWEKVLNTDKITKYVEHPYLDDPPMEAPPPPPPPVKLTKKEQKKLRHQRRVAREQEKQEMIRQGVLEPPKPKVKISNMMRVLTEEAVLDPTMIEQRVKEEMEERQQAHDDRNLARKLTPAERREKKIRKLLRDDTSEAGEVFTHVYRIENMRNVKNKFKVDVNAQENHLTGIGIITDTFTIVIVEGTNKGLKRYEKLMMRRMDWTLTNEDYTDEEIERAENNKCTLVWKGSGPQRKMKRFHFETLRTEAAARKYLETDFKCANYFDAAQSAVSVDDDNVDEQGGDAMET